MAQGQCGQAVSAKPLERMCCKGPVWNMLVCPLVTELLGQAKVYHIHLVPLKLSHAATPGFLLQVEFTFLPSPIRKLSGFMSLWMKFLPWMNSIRLMSWSASRRTVLRLSFLLQKLKRSSRLGPNSSITITLYSPSHP